MPSKDNYMECALKGKVPRDTTQYTNIRKKTASSSPNFNYGCPKDFIKLSEYMCIHVRTDKTGTPIETEFEDSRSYCTKIVALVSVKLLQKRISFIILEKNFTRCALPYSVS